MKFFRQKNSSSTRSITRKEALQCIPVPNISIKITEIDSSTTILEYPLPMKPFFRSIYNRFQNNNDFPTKKLQLDEMGSSVWNCIDGETSTQTIISQFADLYGITLHEAEKSVTTFLVELGKRGLIGMR